MYLVSPTEPPELRALGITSLVPESLGVDYLFLPPQGLYGVQRKTVDDFLGSVRDGRLQRELAQMAGLATAELLIEGRPQFTSSGQMIGLYAGGMTKQGWRNLLRSIQAGGVVVSGSDSLQDTAAALEEFGGWAGKEVHSTLIRRPGPVGVWGTPSSREWCLHVLQGFGSIGPAKAAAILDWFGHLPLEWSVTESELLDVPGVGEKTVKVLMEAVGRRQGGDGDERQRQGVRGAVQGAVPGEGEAGGRGRERAGRAGRGPRSGGSEPC